MRARTGIGLLVAVLVTACSAGATPSSSMTSEVASAPASAAPASIELTVFGAASLKGVLEKAKTEYEAVSRGVTLVIYTDSSATLATQIEQGAPADVFLSADTKNPQKLADGGLAAGPPVAFAGNELAVIVPLGNPARLASPVDLARSGVKVIAAGNAVPITTYANQLVANLGKEPGYPAGFVADYGANVVSMEDNAKAVVAKIELGEGDAAIVYVTDARASGKVDTLAVPAGANVRATYAGVTLKSSAHAAAGTAFLTWLAGPDGQAILSRFGFLPAS